MSPWTAASAISGAILPVVIGQYKEYYLGQFFNLYLDAEAPLHVLEVGSRDLSGSRWARSLASPRWSWSGVDIVAGQGVDVLLEDPYILPFTDGKFDVVLSCDSFEHMDLFWLMFLEMCRVARSWIYLHVPSQGIHHAYPTDSWRFLSDSPASLASWARYRGLNVAVAFSAVMNTSHSGWWKEDPWQRLVSVFSREPVTKRLPRIQAAFAVNYVREYALLCWGRSTPSSVVHSCCTKGRQTGCFRKGWTHRLCCTPGAGARLRGCIAREWVVDEASGKPAWQAACIPELLHQSVPIS